MLLTVMAAFAQEESRSISENVKWGMRKRFEAGVEWRVPIYGYRHTEDEMYIIVPEEAAIVKEIFTRYGAMLRCPHCGEILVHGSLNSMYFGGRRVRRDGGWGCYGVKGCRQFLLIQNVLDEAMLDAHEEKFGTRPEKVDFWWLDELVERISFHEDLVTVRWKDGDKLTLPLNPPHEHYHPSNTAARYNTYLEKLRSGEAKTKSKFIMGL